MAGIEDLEPSISRKMQFGAAQETYLLGDLYRLTKAGLDPNKTIEDIEQERLEKLYEKFPEFRSGEYENDAAVWTGRVGIMASDPIYYAIPFSAATKLTKLGPRLAALSGLGAATGATSGAIQGTARTGEFSLGEVAKNAGIGAAAGPIFYGVGQGLSKVGKTATKLKDPAYRDLVTPNILKTDAPRPVTSVGAKAVSIDPADIKKVSKDDYFLLESKAAKQVKLSPGSNQLVDRNNYMIQSERVGDAMQINAVKILPEYQNQGLGKELYKEAIDDAFKKNLDLVSDNSVSESALRVYKSLENEGFNVIYNKDVFKRGSQILSKDRKQPVVTIKKPVTSVGADVASNQYSKIGQYRGMRKANIARQGDKMKNLETLIKQANKNLDSSKTVQTLAKQVGYKESSVKGKKFTDKVKAKLNPVEENVETAFKRQIKFKDSPVEDFFNLKSKLIKQVTGSNRGPRSLQGEKLWKNLQSKLTSEDIKFLKHLQNTESQSKYIGRGLSYKQARKEWKINTKSGTQPGVGYAAPERKIMEYARRHQDAGGDKIKFLVPIKDESMTSYRNAKFLYKGKEYNLKTLKETSRSDPNFKSFYKAFDQQKRIAAKTVKDPRTGKDIEFGKLMEDVYEKAAGKRLRFGEIDHVLGVGKDPFKNLRVLDQRTNVAAGQILSKAKLQQQGLLSTQAERYTPANVEKMLKKIGYRHTKTEEEIIRDGLKLARDVLLKGRKLEKPLAVASKRFGIKKGGAVMDFSKYRDTYADGGTVMKYRTLMKDLAQIIS